jgi:hypothetical protein
MSLSAFPGEFNVKTLGAVTSAGKISTSARILKFNGTDAWPPAAYVGFYEGPDRKRSIQFLIIRNRGKDPYLVAGYRVIENGRETRIESLDNLPLDARVRVHLTFVKGVVTLKLNDREPHTIRTPFTNVAPYVAVSSGTGEFTVDP